MYGQGNARLCLEGERHVVDVRGTLAVVMARSGNGMGVSPMTRTIAGGEEGGD